MVICMFFELMHSINFSVASVMVKKIYTLIIVLLRTINIVITGFGINGV